MKLYAIYDAGGSLMGELSYIAGKMVGQRECALCDISHGWNPRGKADWRAACAAGSEVTWLHSDEQPPALEAFTRGQLPCVVSEADEQFRVLLDREALAACGGDFNRFQSALNQVLETQGVG